MPLPEPRPLEVVENINLITTYREPKYVHDFIVYPSQEEMKEAIFLENHPCFSKVTVSKQGEYMVTCSASPEKIIQSISRANCADANLANRAAEVLLEEFMTITDAIRFVNSHFNVEFENQSHVVILIDYFSKFDINLPLSFTYLNIMLLEEKLMQYTNKMLSRVEEEKMKEGGEGVDKAKLGLQLFPRIQDYTTLKHIQNDLLDRHSRRESDRKPAEEPLSAQQSEPPMMMYT